MQEWPTKLVVCKNGPDPATVLMLNPYMQLVMARSYAALTVQYFGPNASDPTSLVQTTHDLGPLWDSLNI